jgi:hypothetical protein
MSEHQKETAFLRQCIGYDDTGERHRLEERITQLQRDERIVRRAVWLMALLAALAMAGLGYASVFMEGHPLNVSHWTTLMPVKALSVLGVGSLLCLVVFLALGVGFRKELDRRREDCRRLALKVLESRFGQARVTAPPAAAPEPSAVLNGLDAPATAAEPVQGRLVPAEDPTRPSSP